MEIKGSFINIHLIEFVKRNPNSSVSGEQENSTYTIKCLRLEKTLAFSWEDMKHVLAYLDVNYIKMSKDVRMSWRFMRDNGDHFTLTSLEVQHVYAELITYANDFI
jgi:hypothetical protein